MDVMMGAIVLEVEVYLVSASLEDSIYFGNFTAFLGEYVGMKVHEPVPRDRLFLLHDVGYLTKRHVVQRM